MRRLRIKRINMAVSQNFYNLVEEERKRLNGNFGGKIGYKPNISLCTMTEIMAQDLKRKQLILNRRSNAIQKRRRI